MTIGGVQFPTEYKSRSSYFVEGVPNGGETETVTLISLKLTDKRPADFRLAAFGLPEPIDVAPPPESKWYLWVLAAAGACAALAWLLRYRHRRAQRAAAHLNCRFGLKRADDYSSVPAGASDLECSLQAYRPGPFNSQVHLFVDDGGTRELVFSVSGTARDGKK